MVGHGCTGHHGADGQMDAGEGSTDYSPDCSPLHVSALKGFIFFVQERGRIIASQHQWAKMCQMLDSSCLGRVGVG